MKYKYFKESKTLSSLGAKKKPKIVIKENHRSDKEWSEDTEEVRHSNLELQQMIEQRNSLYRKAMDAKGTHMQVSSSDDFYLFPTSSDNLTEPVTS